MTAVTWFGRPLIHAAARTSGIEIRLRNETDRAVADDGLGFGAADVQLGSGIRGTADRLDTIGGVLEVDSRVGGGTVIRGTMPLRIRDSVSERSPVTVG